MTPEEMLFRLAVIAFAIPAYGLASFWLGVRAGRKWAMDKIEV